MKEDYFVKVKYKVFSFTVIKNQKAKRNQGETRKTRN